MYQNLEAWQGSRPPSVHLCDFPKLDTLLIDERLTADMDRLLDLVSLGLSARNEAKIRVRQPLAELKVRPGNDSDRRAVERFADQIEEELNVKKVTLHPSAEPLLRSEAKPNLKTLGAKFGARLKDVVAAIAKAPADDLAAKVRAGQPFELAGFTLDPSDVLMTLRAPDGWAGAADRDTQVVIDARMTADLKREGMARDVIRWVQQLRKQKNLEMEDRIVLYLQTDSSELRQSIETHRNYIASETLTVEWAAQPFGVGRDTAVIAKIEGQALTILLRKAT
jgi:isoleucyl-tRNA synthetase